MGIPGRKPDPPELHVLRGGRGKRGKTAPRYSPLTGHPPDELSARGKRLWRRLTKELGPAGILQATDREALIALCDMWDIYHENMVVVRENRGLAESGHHNAQRSQTVVSPAWRVAKDALREMEQLWARFGLTPSDRARMESPSRGGAPGDDLLT